MGKALFCYFYGSLVLLHPMQRWPVYTPFEEKSHHPFFTT